MDVYVVIKGVLHDCQLPDIIKTTAGVVVVEHKYGLVQKERPHYHVWFPGTIKLDVLKTQLRYYYDEKIPGLKWNTHANSYYSLKLHNDWEKWIDYVYYKCLDCKDPSIIVWNRRDKRPDVLPDVPRSLDELILPPVNVVTVVPMVTPVSSKSKKDPAYKRFMNYLILKNVKTPSLDQLLDHWFEWTNGNYELRNVSGPVRHAYFELNDKDSDIQKMFVREMRRKLFSDV